MIKSKKHSLIIIGAFLLTLLLGSTTYAFFNYTRTGSLNSMKVGRISFNSSQNGNIDLTNVFPISSSAALTDTTNAKSVAIHVTGDTDYEDGIEYLVTVSDVNMTVGSGANAKTLPVEIEISITNNTNNNPVTSLGTEEVGYYYGNRSSYTTSKYKKLYDGNLLNGSRLLVGYIAPGSNTKIDGIINIKAYISSDKVVISDTYDGSESANMGTSTEWVGDKVVFTTDEWNSIQDSPLSFKVKVEANEGIWVTEPTGAEIISRVKSLETIDNINYYVGTNPDNFVWFNEELWRIIGVYDNKLKIVKYEPLSTKMQFSSSTTNIDWEGSELQEYLINTYYPTLSLAAREKISDTLTWNIGRGVSISSANTLYADYSSITWNGKIGLLSLYEYFAAAGEACRDVNGDSFASSHCTEKDWLYPDITNDEDDDAWTLTKYNGYGTAPFAVLKTGIITNYYSGATYRYVSPVVYLRNEVKIIGGTGEKTNPYLLSYTPVKTPSTMSLSSDGTSINKSTHEVATITTTGDGNINCTSSNTNIATCSISNNKLLVTGVSVGNAIITVSQEEGPTKYAPSDATFTILVSKTATTLSLSSASGTTYTNVGRVVGITTDGDGTLSCLSSNSSVATCSINNNLLTVVGESVGNTTITVSQTEGNIMGAATDATYQISVSANNVTAAQVIENIAPLDNIAGAKRYTGAIAYNYVIFNSEQWRIVGVYGDKLKIVRATPTLTDQKYINSTSDSNAWSGSNLETVLNGTYYDGLSNTAQQMIYENGSWNVGSVTFNSNASDSYTQAQATTFTGKVGLIATYEYLYAAENDGTCWTTFGGSYSSSCAAKDWLYATLLNNDNISWLDTPFAQAPNMSYALASSGNFGVYNANVSSGSKSSPVVYLNSTVKIASGSGQSGDEYILSYNPS